MADDDMKEQRWGRAQEHKACSENEQPGHPGAGEALHGDFEVRNLYDLQQAIGELKNFP